jgi:hypothetical protein
VRPGDELAEPLSKLAANMGSVEVSEMDAFVRRSADLRLKVVKGVLVPARPLNAFMLYRKTYSKHVQPLNGNKDNQRVSRMTGASWLAEDEEVRDRFHGYAHIEQEYHREAFPDYKFSPKPRPRANKQRARIEEDDELDSEYDNLSVPGPPDL